MKKIIYLTIVMLLCFSLFSCNINSNLENDNDIDLNMIYEIGNQTYDTDNTFNHTNIISNVIYSKDDSAPLTLKYKINDIESELIYHETLYFPVGERKVHLYRVDGIESNKVLLSPDGAIDSILYSFTTIDISKSATPNEVLSKLNVELNKWIKTSEYEYVDIPKISDINPDGFGSYIYYYYNEIDGYKTDRVSVCVLDDGKIMSLKIRNLDEDIDQLNINKELESKMIDQKLNDIYTTDKTEYKSYNMSTQPVIVKYNGELYVEYGVSANYLKNKQETTSFINNILIPLELINNK